MNTRTPNWCLRTAWCGGKAPTQELDAHWTCLNQDGFMLREISQGEKGKHCVVIYLWNVKERKEGWRKGRKGQIHRNREYKSSCRRWKWKSLSGVGSLSLLQEIFPTQGLNPGLLHCRLIPYQLSHKGSPARDVGRVNRDQLAKWCQLSAVRQMWI